MCTLARYAEDRKAMYKNEEIAFAKMAQSKSIADVLKEDQKMLKLDIENILTEMNCWILIQQENKLKEVLSIINEFFNNVHDKVTFAAEQKLNFFHEKIATMGKKCLQLLTKQNKSMLGCDFVCQTDK